MEPNQTLNSGESSTPTHAGDELISTVEFSTTAPADTDPGEANNTQAQTQDAANKTEQTEDTTPEGTTKEAKAGDTADGEATRFDKHPRFVELNRRVKSFDEENRLLREELDKIKTSLTQQNKDPDPPPFKDWSGMSEDELLDWQSTDPKGFLDNMLKRAEFVAQAKFDEYRTQLDQQSQKQSQEQAVVSTYEAYAKDNPDFDEMWDSGEIKSYMDKHPGHNPISAHMAMTADAKAEARAKEAAEKAVKEYEAALRSKRASNVLGAGPATIPTESRQADDRLKNPKKYGGITNVLTARLLERRKAAGI